MDECGIYGVLYTEDALVGIVDSGSGIQGKLQATSVLVGEVGFPKCYFPDTYEGEYEVTPKVYAQMLDTDDKYMREDVTVKAIPYFETSNEKGTTVYIGNEL